MILLLGIPTEAPLARVAEALDALGARTMVFNQRRAREARCEFELDSAGARGTLAIGRERVRLETVTAVYTRLMDDRLLPELNAEPADSEVRRACRGLHDTLFEWLELTTARVVNRGGPMASNNAKPFQIQLIRAAGFEVPETLVTNEPELVHKFLEHHGSVVYKSISGTRSIVRELEEDDLARLDDIRWCPVQFQAFVQGVDVRVHVIGEEVFATRIRADGSDYRYSARAGVFPQMEATR